MTQTPSALRELAQKTKRRVAETIEKLLAVSEEHVLAAGDSVATVNAEARAQVSDLEEMAQLLDAESGNEQSLVRVLGRQMTAMDRMSDALSTELGRFDAVANGSATHTVAIQRMAEEISAIALSTKILTVNAQIEAARLGELGAPFAVIAAEMNDLNRRVSSASKGITAIADELARALPKLAQSSQRLTTEYLGRVRENRALNEEAKRAYEAVQSSTAEKVATSRERAGRLVKSSQDVLSHLQYTESVRSALGKVNGAVERLVDAVDETLRETAAATKLPLSLPPPVRTAISEAPPPAQESGEVLLF